MKEIVADTSLIARCGLYCGACTRYLKDKCPGCSENEKASWCKVRSCCNENSFASCADCTQYDDISQCGYLNNFIAKVFGFIFRSDRKACLVAIKNDGYEAFAREMADSGKMSYKR